MTPAELRSILSRLALTQMRAAECLGVDGSTMRRWLSGKRAVPETVARVLRVSLDHPWILQEMGEWAFAASPD